MAEEQAPPNTTASLNWKNYLNVLAFILNCVITFGIGNFGWFGASTNGDLSDKYQTLVTPAGSAFSIWGVIFIFQGIFIVYQLLPSVRAKPMVQDGVSYWYILACLFQCAWTPAFGFEQITAALVFITLIWLSLIGLVYSQYNVTNGDNNLLEYWLLRFPFAIHCGWLTAASVLNVNVLAVKLELSAEVQLAMGIVSLAYLHAVSVWVVFGFAKPNYTIAGVLAWANGWISNELNAPKEAITERFGGLVVSSVQMAALAVSFIIVGQVVVRVALLCVPSCAINQRLTTTAAAADGEDSSKKEQPAATRSINKTSSNASVYSNNVESSV